MVSVDCANAVLVGGCVAVIGDAGVEGATVGDSAAVDDTVAVSEGVVVIGDAGTTGVSVDDTVAVSEGEGIGVAVP